MDKRWILVGDVHATVNELDDCEKLVDLIVGQVSDGTEVLFLGDQYHTHATLRIEVVDFWNRAIQKINDAGGRPIFLVGNHDMPHDSSQGVDSMMANTGGIVVRSPQIFDRKLLMPYYHDHQKFVDDVNRFVALSKVDTLICHQTFNGAKYENGFYAKDAIDPEVLNVPQIISGHIHTPAEFDKVIYIGAPRWRTASDANIERFIHLYDADFNLESKIPTGTHCRRILQATVYEDGTYTGNIDADDKDILHVDVVGSKEFCDAKKAQLASQSVRVRIFPKMEKTIKVKESDGIDSSFRKYLESYCAGSSGFDPEAVQTMVQNAFTS